MAELAAGTSFAGHEIRGVAGRGGMGIVYRAFDARLKREVALKVIAPEQSKDGEFRIRFQRECEVAASLHHPNLIPVYTAGEEDGHLYVTMRFVDGVDLAHLIERHRRLSPTHATHIIVQVARALDAAHHFGVVHRDVKPANVLLDGEHALLTDFGLQRDLRATTRITEPGTLIGTFDYTAPEQLEDGEIDARADVYALGCVLYEAVTGEVPFPRDTPAAKLYAHLGAPVPHVEGPLGPVIRQALAKRPEDRFPSAGAFGQAALAALGGGRTRVAPAAAPLPRALLNETGSEPFVGRAELRERIAALRGKRRFVVIEGEPGIGKTRLAAEAARDAHAAGATVLYGRCDPESLLPYQPFAMALPDISESDRFAYFDAVARRLAERPTVLILDDLHWAAPSTLQLLAHVLEEPGELLILATATPGHRLPAAERLTLGGLERRELSAFVEALGEREPENLHERTGGNPFFARETLRADGLPVSIRDVVSRRLASLSEPTRAALTVAAVIGHDFRLDVLETLAEHALEAVEEASAQGLVRDGEAVDHFRFAHALVRETLAGDMSNARRTRLHRSIGEALERTPGITAAELARHFFAARHLDPQRAFTYELRAAHEAEHEAAVLHYRHARELRPERLDVLLALGTAELRTGDPAFRATFQEAAARARETGDREALARAALGFNARQAASAVLDPAGIALLEEADAHLADSPLRARVKARLATALHFAGQAERTLQLSADALALERSGETLLARHGALLDITHLDERLELAEELIALEDPELLALGRFWFVFDLMEAGRVVEAREQHDALVQLADELHQPLFRHLAAVWDAIWAQMADRTGDVERLIDRAHALGVRAAAPDAELIRLAQLMTLRLQQGRLPEFLDAVEPLDLPVWRAAFAVGLLVCGERERGAALYATLDEATIPRDMVWLTTISLLATAATLLADAPRAERLYALLLPHRERMVQHALAANAGSVERHLGSLAAVRGNRALAAQHFERALERNQGHAQALRLTRMEYAQRSGGEHLTAASVTESTLSPPALSDPPPRPGWS
ncbi:protein kinase [Solirubrobacter sp. CPCC 204708]|uniref:non-specific serine/threonine protein kinase n=1 Tax=Solirubrobacter deserti TaxID=2282478 RepID=A0ABT4RGI9_9ACTN|nr:serine/threonine-protein kinase [Solirubrobacter deserti]MBE2319603.1 protein kinase [Solirubrobacter deserti]MDA0137658.1 protein kinase [Solirubrobacter deserti]